MDEQIKPLTGELGRHVYTLYRNEVDQRFKRNPQLYIKFSETFERYDLMFDEKDGTVKGCGGFSMALVSEILQREGYRTAELSDIHIDSSLNLDDLRGFHFNFGLILNGAKRTTIGFEDGYHHGTNHLRVDFTRQLKQLGENFSLPVYIPFSALKLREEPNTPFGLSFDIINKSLLYSSAAFKGRSERKVTGKEVFHISRAEREDLFMSLLFTNVTVTEPEDIEEMIKPTHSLIIEKFDKMSGSYGRVLIVPESVPRSLRSPFKKDEPLN